MPFGFSTNDILYNKLYITNRQEFIQADSYI